MKQNGRIKMILNLKAFNFLLTFNDEKRLLPMKLPTPKGLLSPTMMTCESSVSGISSKVDDWPGCLVRFCSPLSTTRVGTICGTSTPEGSTSSIVMTCESSVSKASFKVDNGPCCLGGFRPLLPSFGNVNSAELGNSVTVEIPSHIKFPMACLSQTVIPLCES